MILAAFSNTNQWLKLRGLRKDARGSMALTFAVASPLFIMAAAFAVDMGYLYVLRSKLQATVDAVALEVVSKASMAENIAMSLITEDTLRDAENDAIEIGRRNLPLEQSENAVISSDITIGEWDPVENKFISEPPFRLINAVRVQGELSEERGNQVPSFFRDIFNKSVPVRTSTVAVMPPIPTIHTLDPEKSGSFTIGSRADLDTIEVWTNSTARDALDIQRTSFSLGLLGAFTPGRSTHSSRRIKSEMYSLKDLLADEPNPNIRGCGDVRGIDPSLSCNVYRNMVINITGTTVIRPGIYEGGLVIEAAQEVKMMPGIYVFKDGPLEIRRSSFSRSSFSGTSVTGENVMLNFTGSGARLELDGGTLAIKGLETGPYQGYVMFSDRETTTGETHRISSGVKFIGTIYAPTNDFIIEAALNGSCHTLCLVAANITMNNGLSNITSLQTVSTFGTNGGDFPAPLALHTSLVPFLRSFEGNYVAPEPADLTAAVR